MRRITAIFFLFIFFLFQYGRLIDYAECRIISVINTAPVCDCESKLVASSQNGDTPQLPHQHHLKNFTDELIRNVQSTEMNVPVQQLTITFPPATSLYKYIFVNCIFHPPGMLVA